MFLQAAQGFSPLLIVLIIAVIVYFGYRELKKEKSTFRADTMASMLSGSKIKKNVRSITSGNSPPTTNIDSESDNPLDLPLIKFTEDRPTDWWTVRDAVRGTQIFGGIGSGKSSGSGKAVAKSFLKNGFGGLVLCAKSDERDNWIKMCEEVGRGDDVIVFEEDSDWQFNPLEYEQNRSGQGAGEVLNLSNLFMAIYKMSNRLSGGGSSGESERYWDAALKRSLNRMIQLLKLADKELSVANMRRLISSVPMDYEAKRIPEMTDEELVAWGETNFCLECVIEAGNNLGDDEEAHQEYDLVYDYFLREFPALPENTRPTIVESFLGIAEPFTTGILKKHFSGEVNLDPEESFNGKIIILDFPVKEYLDAGVYAQGIYKLIWQQAAERREINDDTLPCFLWVDEAQLFLSDYDQIFQTTARSSRTCTVFISQNISNYYVAIGGNNPKPKADSLLGNLSTKIFHSNNDTVTNEWGSQTIGKAFREMENLTVGDRTSMGLSQQFHWQVEPREFTTLKSGAEECNYRVEGVITIAGRKWSNGRNFIKRSFNQQA